MALTNKQLEELAEVYHSRDCRLNHMDQCGWEYENSPDYPDKPGWTHEHWKKRVPELLAKDGLHEEKIHKILEGVIGNG